MRWAILSDIHANLEALDACLAHAREKGANAHALLGDFVGYGADAVGVVARVMALNEAGAVALKGNHDAAIAAREGYFNHDAQAALDWARETLTDDQKRFLESLPLVSRHGDVTFVHASADPDGLRLALDRAKGIVMRLKGLSEEEAYALLRKTAMNEKRKLVDIARSIITAAEVLK